MNLIMKILIIEDNTALKESLSHSLTTQGWEITTASSYKEALIFIDKDFDFYVIDILLPDNKGYELLNHFNKKKSSQFIFISGFFDLPSILKYIPSEHQSSCSFLKKPFDLNELLEQINKLTKEASKSNFESDDPHRTFKSFLPKSKTFDIHKLTSILFLALKFKFSGVLELHLNNKQKHLIEMTDGFVNKIISEDMESYFGILLVEHGLSRQEDIQKILDNNNNKYIGEQLVNKSLLSPHMLNFILKEQIKIRLTQIMSHLSFSVNISEEQMNQKESDATLPSFNEQDLIEWTIDILKTKIKDSFLESFYIKNKYNFLKANHNIQQSIFHNKDFIEKYNNFFKKITKDMTFEKLMKDLKKTREHLEFIYFGFLTESITILTTETKENNKKTEVLINHILQNKTDDLFQILNIPWKSSKEEVEKSYKKLIQQIHPDKVPPNSSKQLTNRYKEAFQKIQESYKILSNTNEREVYLKNQEGNSFLNILSIYEKGTNLIKSGKFEAGLNTLKAIENNVHTPGNSFLYMLWAKIQLAGDIHNNKEKAGSLKREIEKCPIDQRVSPLFWFITGLYYKNTRNYEKALILFKKTVQLKKDFREAHQAITMTQIKMKKELKKNNNNLFTRFLNKKSS